MTTPKREPTTLGMLLFVGVSAAAFFALVEWGSYRHLLNLDALPLTSEERMLAPLSVLGKTLYLMLLPTLVAVGVACWRRDRTGWAILLSLQTLVFLVLAIDLVVYEGAGRHLVQVAAFLELPRHDEVVGGRAQWIWMVVRWLLLIAAGSLLLWQGCSRLADWAWPRLSPLIGRVLLGAVAALMLGLALLPQTLGVMWRHAVVRERVYGAMPIDPRYVASHADEMDLGDPALAPLARGLRDAYVQKFPLVFSAKPGDPQARLPAVTERRPGVLIIALESFRADSLTRARMPKLTAWAERGLWLKRHYTGSIFSEAGLFALVYGRSPLLYHATLDARVKPELCEVLRRSGYRCGYFTGHPKIWFRREDYLNAENFAVFAHDDRGDWNQWDRTALANLARETHAPGQPPLFGLAFLMSTHFEYQYPPEYEHHTPVTRRLTWKTTQLKLLRPELREPLLNRYRNALGFMDDVVDEAIRALDPSRNYIVVTGDHGESLNDDGRFGHGSAFSDIVAQVPMFILGPGLEPGQRRDLSLHIDLLPTLLHLLGGEPLAVAHTHGRDLLAGGAPRESVLLAHCEPSQQVAEALLLQGERRVRLTLDLHAPRLQVLGLEDPRARLVVEPNLDATVTTELVSAFDAALGRLIH